jgi:hypothetical protein
MLPPNNMAIRQLSKEEGIAEATLHKWRAQARGQGQLLPDAAAGSQGWTSRDKFAAVLETAVTPEAGLAEYERKRAVFPAQIKAWRMACDQANDWDCISTAKMKQATREERKRIKELGRKLSRKDRALARSCSASGARKKADGDLGRGRGRMTRTPDHQAATLLIAVAKAGRPMPSRSASTGLARAVRMAVPITRSPNFDILGLSGRFDP